MVDDVAARGHIVNVLNLFAGIGGNRALWNDVAVTSVENDADIMAVYRQRFPKDVTMCCDALRFLEASFDEFDFIWISPPCQSHGQLRHNVGVLAQGKSPIVPDMTPLYGTIVFLRTYFKGKWLVENTIPYYKPLIEPSGKLGRHLVWSNFALPSWTSQDAAIRRHNRISDFADASLVEGTPIKNKRQVLHNCVDAELGLALLNAARGTP